MTNRKGYGLSIGTKIDDLDDLELLYVQFLSEFRDISHVSEASQ